MAISERKRILYDFNNYAEANHIWFFVLMINQIEFYSFPHDDYGRYDQVIMKLLYSFVGTSAHWLLGFSGGRRVDRVAQHYHIS